MVLRWPNGRSLSNVVKHQLSVTDLACSRLDRKRLDPSDHPAITDQVPLVAQLHEEHFVRHGGPIAVGPRSNEEHPAALVETDLTFNRFGNLHLDRCAPGSLCDFVDNFLGKRVEEQRAVAVPSADDGVKGLAPASPVLLLTVAPGPDDRL